MVLPLYVVMHCVSELLMVYTNALSSTPKMTILLRMDDKMNRQLTCQVSQEDSATTLSHELVHLGFIHEVSVCVSVWFTHY